MSPLPPNSQGKEPEAANSESVNKSHSDGSSSRKRRLVVHLVFLGCCVAGLFALIYLGLSEFIDWHALSMPNWLLIGAVAGTSLTALEEVRSRVFKLIKSIVVGPRFWGFGLDLRKVVIAANAHP